MAPKRNRLVREPVQALLACVAICAAPIRAETIPVNWASQGTFDITNFSSGTAINTFSLSSPFELVDVNLRHTVDTREDRSLRLFGGEFDISANNGDSLHGTYEDFIYESPDEQGTYLGSGPFALVGGTGQFAGYTGSGSWNATARFTSDVGGTADYVWQGSITPADDPHELGPLAIGHQLIEIPWRSRPILADVWYPVDPSDAVGNLASYKTFPGINFQIPSPVAIASAPVSNQGSFPLIVFFHGGINTYGATNSSLTESLASHGFVVVGPHGWTDARPIVDYFQAQSADVNGPFHGAIDASNVGVVGHSAGAEVTLQNAGRDDRIKALMPISTSGAGVNDVNVPTLLLTGTLDFWRGSTESFFRTASATPRYLGVIQKAGHGSFGNTCDRLEYARQNGAESTFIDIYAELSSDACTERHIPNERAIELTNRYAVSFFKTHLAVERQFADFLTPEYTDTGQLEVDFARVPWPADLNDDDELNGDDINTLASAIATGSTKSLFDLSGDGQVSLADIDAWLATKGTLNGDANLDGTVQFADFLVLANSYGQSGTWTDGDFDANGQVQFPDYTILANHFGQSAAGIAAAVPEPTTALLLLIGVLGLRIRLANGRFTRGSRVHPFQRS